MLPAEIIRKKRDGLELSQENLKAFIGGYVTGDITDYQASAMLMAIFFQGMNPRETADLTRVMMDSGIKYTLKTDRPLIDKHSTGGVGDKVSLVLAPLAAACGLADPMVSGRGLGHTGGTLDKLESIPGLNVHLTTSEFEAQVAELGVAMLGQSDDFVPADKKLYALRDVTATVESIPLLCSSILSKKAASGARGIVMDVKCGTGAFMNNLEGAQALARGLVDTGKALDLPVRCLITNMNQPLGRAIGNALETAEAIDCLKGGGPDDLREITVALVSEMLILGGLEQNLQAARECAEGKLDGGSAWGVFREIVKRQGGDVASVEDVSKLPQAKHTKELVSDKSGFVSVGSCRDLGLAALVLGAGRNRITDKVDPGVGIVLHKKHGDEVTSGERLATMYFNERGVEESEELFWRGLQVQAETPVKEPLIFEKLA